MATTSTAALAASGATASLALTGAAVIAGTASLPVFAGMTPNAAVPGVYIQGNPAFVGSWCLSRHPAGMQTSAAISGGTTSLWTLVQGDDVFLKMAGAGPIATITATDAVALTLTGVSAGSATLTAVQ